MKAILYCRVSSEEQARGFSLEAQEQDGLAYAKKKGIEVIQVFKVTESAAQEGRERFNEAVRILTQHRDVEILLVYKMDRAVRNLADTSLIDKLAHQHDKQIHFFHEGWEYTKNSSVADFYRFGFMSVLATGFSRNLSDITKVGMRKKAEAGEYPHIAPFGYKNNKEARTVEPEPAESPWVIRIKTLSAADYSIERIIVQLKAECCPFQFWESKIERIIKSTFYHGVFEWGGQVYAGTYKTILDRALHEAAVHGLTRPGKGKVRKHILAYRGLMTCDFCGCTITGDVKKGGRFIYYRCTWGRGKCSNTQAIEQRFLDQQFEQILGQVHVDENWARAMFAELERTSGQESAIREGQLAVLKQEQRRVASRIETAYDDKLDGNLEEIEWVRRTRKWKERLIAIEADIKALETGNPGQSLRTLKSTIELINSLKTQFQSLPTEKKGQVLKYSLSNLRLRHKTVLFSYAKPFSFFVENPHFESVGPTQDVSRTPTRDDFRTWFLSGQAPRWPI